MFVRNAGACSATARTASTLMIDSRQATPRFRPLACLTCKYEPLASLPQSLGARKPGVWTRPWRKREPLGWLISDVGGAPAPHPNGCPRRVSVSINLSLHSLVVFLRVSLRQTFQRLGMTGVLFSRMQTLECFSLVCNVEAPSPRPRSPSLPAINTHLAHAHAAKPHQTYRPSVQATSPIALCLHYACPPSACQAAHVPAADNASPASAPPFSAPRPALAQAPSAAAATDARGRRPPAAAFAWRQGGGPRRDPGFAPASPAHHPMPVARHRPHTCGPQDDVSCA